MLNRPHLVVLRIITQASRDCDCLCLLDQQTPRLEDRLSDLSPSAARLPVTHLRCITPRISGRRRATRAPVRWSLKLCAPILWAFPCSLYRVRTEPLRVANDNSLKGKILQPHLSQCCASSGRPSLVRRRCVDERVLGQKPLAVSVGGDEPHALHARGERADAIDPLEEHDLLR